MDKEEVINWLKNLAKQATRRANKAVRENDLIEASHERGYRLGILKGVEVIEEEF